MNTITVNPNLNNIYGSIAELNSNDLDNLLLQIKKIKYKHFPTVLSNDESELLKKINAGLPNEIHRRYLALRSKRQKETLNQKEHDELIMLTGTIEEYDVQRLQWLIELAKLRNVTLNEVVKQLGLKTKVYVA